MSDYNITTLSRRLSRAGEQGKGIKLEARDIDLLCSLGVFDKVHSASSEFLKEQSLCRIARRQSIDGGNTGSTSSAEPMGPNVRRIGTSSGMTSTRDARQARQRARQTTTKR